MKIKCNKSDLSKAINNVSHSVPVRTTSPILEGILFEVENNKMTLTSTDTNMTIETFISVECNEKISFVVPAKLLINIVSKLPSEEVNIEYNYNKNNIIIKSAGSKTEIICFSADEFPKLKLEESDNYINISKEDIKNLIRKTAFCASTDEFNAILTGVLFEIKDNNVRMVGVDPFRIAICNNELKYDNDISVVIPAKLIIEISKIINEENDEDMSINITDNKVILRFDNNKVTVNTLSGKFVDYNRIISNKGNIKVRVKRSDLIKSIERASILTSIQNNNLIKINIDNDILTINSLSEEGNIEEKLEVIKEGEDIKIGINAKYLKDALSVIDEEEVYINFKDSLSPCIISPLKGDKYTYLILPIRMN